MAQIPRSSGRFSGRDARRQQDEFDDLYLEEYEEYDDVVDYELRSRKPKPKRKAKGLQRGIVVRARGHHYDVMLLDDSVPGAAASSSADFGNDGMNTRMCEVRGRLLQERDRDTLVAVGDTVMIEPHGNDKGWIEEVEERESVLSRQQPGVSVPAEDVILANPDQLLAVFAVAEPEPHLRMLDRFLVIAEANELPAMICANKVELTGMERAKELFGGYEEIGYPVYYTSAKSGLGIKALGDLLADKMTVLAGPSGVGKSSLLNAVHPSLEIEVGALRNFQSKGRHTTRGARLFPLPFGRGTFVADTPGIRELGLYEIDPHDLGFFFREFVPFIHDCRYPNCTHDHEPGCAIRDAVEDGQISVQRYDSYLRLLRGEE